MPEWNFLLCDCDPPCNVGRHMHCCLPRLWQRPPDDVNWYCCPQHDPARRQADGAAAAAADGLERRPNPTPLQRPTFHPTAAAMQRAATAEAAAHDLRAALLAEFADLDSTPCRPAQQAILDQITSKTAGLAVLTGGPGSGKTFTTKKLTRLLRQRGRSVMLSASTGAAATRLSAFAATNHTAFGLPCRGAFTPWQLADPRAELLRLTDVFILDEFSMMNQVNLMHVLLRIAEANKYAGPEDVLRKKLVVLVGDHAQVGGGT